MMHQTIYDYQQHVDTAEALDAMGKLPKKFEALQVPSRDENLVWSDICRMRTLNGTQAQKCREKHICPLQFDIVDRTIDRWSNPGDWVLDPFGGLMTVPYRAIKFNRKGYGIELNPVSWNDGVEHCQGMEREVNQPDMFELLGIGELVIREKELFSF
jgi:DNA modification methylase